MPESDQDRNTRPQDLAAMPGLLVPVLVTHVFLAAIPTVARKFVIWDASTPTSDAAFRIMNTVRPLVWPLTGAMLLGTAAMFAITMIRRAQLRPSIRPAEAAAAFVLLAFATYALGMELATPRMSMMRIASSPLTYLPIVPAYVLLWRNRLAGAVSGTKARTTVALMGLPSVLLFASAMLRTIL